VHFGFFKFDFNTEKRPWEIALLITTGIMISIMCRIIFDGINDPSTHNLFPFEIIAALLFLSLRHLLKLFVSIA
jgi:hypothetical protein